MFISDPGRGIKAKKERSKRTVSETVLGNLHAKDCEKTEYKYKDGGKKLEGIDWNGLIIVETTLERRIKDRKNLMTISYWKERGS